MPKVTIVYDAADGSRLRSTVETEPNHPDGLLCETMRVCVEGFAATHNMSYSFEEEDET